MKKIFALIFLFVIIKCSFIPKGNIKYLDCNKDNICYNSKDSLYYHNKTLFTGKYYE